MSFIIFSDLDRTLIPNGLQHESEGVRNVFCKLIKEFRPILVYVSGRDICLVQEAIEQYELPGPDWIICDVGTAMYQFENSSWHKNESWQHEIRKNWPQGIEFEIKNVLSTLPFLQLQESSKQTSLKVSFYSEPINIYNSVEVIKNSLADLEDKPAIVTSIDETCDIGLVDIIPINATKLSAVCFLVKNQKQTYDKVVYFGDSGNDMPVLISDIPAVLVANATDQVRSQAVRLSEENGNVEKLYLAKGWSNINGNYCAGVLEGLAYYVPETKQWIEQQLL